MEHLDPNCHLLRPLSDYCKRIPSRIAGKRLNRATLWRWARKGPRGDWKLRTVEIGGGRFTCDAWVWAFIHRKPTGPSSSGSLRPVPPEVRASIEAELGMKPRKDAA